MCSDLSRRDGMKIKISRSLTLHQGKCQDVIEGHSWSWGVHGRGWLDGVGQHSVVWDGMSVVLGPGMSG